MDKKTLGLYNKFNVKRTDGRDFPGDKHEKCDYFVLDLTHDPFAIPAILAYARACQEDYPVLAAELEIKYGAKEAPDGKEG